MKMIEYEKRRLSRIVRSISKDDLEKFNITELWERYGYEFEYGTFRKYLRIVR